MSMSLQEAASQVGRRATKFCPANVQKIKDWVAKGISREAIAKSLDVTIGSLQVTCSRLGISLRTRKMFERRRRVESRPYIPNHPLMVGHIGPEPQYPWFQIIVEYKGLQQVTDVSLGGLEVARLALEAEAAKSRNDSVPDASRDHGDQEGHDRRDFTRAVPGACSAGGAGKPVIASEPQVLLWLVLRRIWQRTLVLDNSVTISRDDQ